jgi:hypothetical protein
MKVSDVHKALGDQLPINLERLFCAIIRDTYRRVPIRSLVPDNTRSVPTMEVSRLLGVVDDIDQEYERGLSKLLKDLVQRYTAARDNPAQDNTAAIQQTLDALDEYLDDSVFRNYPPSKAAILAAIGGTERVGLGFQERLSGVLSVSGQTTAGIVARLNVLRADLDEFQEACKQVRTGLNHLGITPHTFLKASSRLGS